MDQWTEAHHRDQGAPHPRDQRISHPQNQKALQVWFSFLCVAFLRCGPGIAEVWEEGVVVDLKWIGRRAEKDLALCRVEGFSLPTINLTKTENQAKKSLFILSFSFFSNTSLKRDREIVSPQTFKASSKSIGLSSHLRDQDFHDIS